MTNCCYNIKFCTDYGIIYVISPELSIEKDHFANIKREITPVKT